MRPMLRMLWLAVHYHLRGVGRAGRAGHFLSVLLGLGLLLVGCNTGGNHGSLEPQSDPAPALERQAVDNLIALYRTALRQADIDRVDALLQPTAPQATTAALVAQRAQRQVEEGAVTNVQALRATLTTTFRTRTVTALDIPADTIKVAPDRRSVTFLEVESTEDPVTLVQQTRLFRTTLGLSQDEVHGTVTVRIGTVQREGPMVQVTTPGQVQAGALTRIEVRSTGEPFALAGVEVTVPETGAVQALIAIDDAWQGVFTAPMQPSPQPLRVQLHGAGGEALVLQHPYRLRVPGEGVVNRVGVLESVGAGDGSPTVGRIEDAIHFEVATTRLLAVTVAPDGTVWAGGDPGGDRRVTLYQVPPGATRATRIDLRLANSDGRVEALVIDQLGRLHVLALNLANNEVVGHGDIIHDPAYPDLFCQTVNIFDTAYPFRDPQGQLSASTRAQAAGGGDVWLFGSDGGVARVQDSFRGGECPTLRPTVRYAPVFRRDTSALPTNMVPAFVAEADGTLWFGTALGLTRLQQEHFTSVPFDRSLTVSGNVATLEVFFQAVAQALFTAKPLTTVALGGVSFVEQFGRPLVKEDLIFSAVAVAPGQLWVGTLGGGLRRIDGRGATPQGTRHLTQVNGLPSNLILALAVGPDGALWVATDKGVTRLSEVGDTITLTTFAALDGLALPVRDVAVDAVGTAWLATDGGLFRIVPKGGTVQGLVVDAFSHPVVGADVTLLGTPFHAVTDATGHFALANLPSGPQLLHVDGRLAMGGPFTEAFRTVAVLDKETQTLEPVMLVLQVPSVTIDPAQGGRVTFPAAPGAVLDLLAHAVQLPTGVAPRLSLTLLPLSSLPVPLPAGFIAGAAATLGPAGTAFTVPVALTLPNQGALPAGHLVVPLQLDPTSLQYVEVGRGQVSADGTVITTLSGGLTDATTVVFVLAPEPPPDTRLIVVAGDGQSGTVGTTLAEPLVVAVVQAGETPVPNLPVTFMVTASQSTLAPGQPVLTDAQGRAKVTLTLGTQAGIQQVTATAPGLAPVTFTVTGMADRDHVRLLKRKVNNGDNQVGKRGERLPLPLVVRLEDQFANPVEGVTVTGRVIFGGVVFVNPSASPATLATALRQSQTSDQTVRKEVTGGDGEARFFVQVVSTVSEARVEMTAPQVGTPVRFLLNVTRILVGRAPEAVAVADLDHDGHPDLVTANRDSNDVSVLLGHGDGTFAAQPPIAVGTKPQAVVVADLNHDGHPDLVTANNGSDDVSVWLGRGDGTFVAQPPVAVGFQPQAIAAADLNHDGHPDLVTANVGSHDVSVLLGRGDGTFAAQPPIAVGDSPMSVGVADLNHDGHPDLVTANRDSNDVSVLLGHGDGTFAAQPPIAVGTKPQAVVVADLNHDGHPDLVTANNGSDDVSVWLGRGDGTFVAQPPVAVGFQPRAIAAADLDHDGLPDLVTANAFSSDVSVLLGGGDGTFMAEQRFVVGVTPVSIAVADLDHDGHLDLVTANAFSSDVSVLLGRGDGTFAAQPRIAVGAFPVSVAVADLNHDGLPDLVTANNGSDDVSVRLGRGDGTFAAQPPIAVGTKPQAIAVADLNHDGHPDLVTANAGSCNVSVRLGRGDGTFAAQPCPARGFQPQAIAVADLNHDGHPDLVTANRDSNDVSVLLGHGDGTFAAQPPIAVGTKPQAVVVADLNHDGHPDLVTANVGSHDVSVRLGRGDGTFAAQPPIAVGDPVGDGPVSVAVADLNHDGHPDLVTANVGSRDVSVRLGHGDGTFAAEQRFAVGFQPQAIAVADLDHDGLPDLVTANTGSNDVSVRLGGGDGTFAAEQRFAVGVTPMSIAVADLDHDGLPDLVTANAFSYDVSVLLGGGDGTFAAEQRFAVGFQPQAIAVADLNHDGLPDLVTANLFSLDVSVLLGGGDGTFAAEQRFARGFQPQAIAVADLNHDGHPDLVTANAGPCNVSVLLGRGDGTFAAQPPIAVGTKPQAIAVADLNHDGHPDLVTANAFSNDVSVLLGHGDGTFAAEQRFAVDAQSQAIAVSDFNVGAQPRAVAVADLNGDITPDLVTADAGFSAVTVLLGRGDGTFGKLQLSP